MSQQLEKEDIIKYAFDILKEKGMVSEDDIISIYSRQTVFNQINTMNELMDLLWKYCLDDFYDYLMQLTGNFPTYQEIGINYIRFAREKANVFQFIFLNNNMQIEKMTCFDKSYDILERTLLNKFSKEATYQFHLKMWLFIHGMACLSATKSYVFTDEEINLFLKDQLNSLLLYIDS